MKMKIEILPRKTIIHVEGSVKTIKEVAPTIIFTSKKERESLGVHYTMDSLFKDYELEHEVVAPF